MAYCQHCGQPLSGAFCARCGAPAAGGSAQARPPQQINVHVSQKVRTGSGCLSGCGLMLAVIFAAIGIVVLVAVLMR